MEVPAIILSGEVGKTEEFHRSNHPDFSDSSELKKIQFSGIRHNNILDTYEIWTLGDLRASMSAVEAYAYPEKWEALYSTVFALEDVKQLEKEN